MAGAASQFPPYNLGSFSDWVLLDSANGRSLPVLRLSALSRLASLARLRSLVCLRLCFWCLPLSVSCVLSCFAIHLHSLQSFVSSPLLSHFSHALPRSHPIPVYSCFVSISRNILCFRDCLTSPPVLVPTRLGPIFDSAEPIHLTLPLSSTTTIAHRHPQSLRYCLHPSPHRVLELSTSLRSVCDSLNCDYLTSHLNLSTYNKEKHRLSSHFHRENSVTIKFSSCESPVIEKESKTVVNRRCCPG